MPPPRSCARSASRPAARTSSSPASAPPAGRGRVQLPVLHLGRGRRGAPVPREAGRADPRFGPEPDRPGIEFDYCCVHAARELPASSATRPLMVNCNPETVSTDYDTSDRLYFEPLDARGRPRDLLPGRSPRASPVQFRRPNAAEARACTRGGRPRDSRDTAGCGRPRRGPRALRRAAATSSGIAVPPVGDGDRAPTRAVTAAEQVGYPGPRAPVLRPRRTPDARSATPPTERRALRRRRLTCACSSTGSSRPRSSSTSTRFCDGPSGPYARRGHAARGGGGRPLRATFRPACSRRFARSPMTSWSRCAMSCAGLLAPGARGCVGFVNVQLRAGGRRALRPRGEPARLPHRAVREQGDRREPDRRGVPPHGRRATRRAGAPPRGHRGAGERQGGRLPVRPLPRRRPRAGPEIRSTGEVMASAADFPTAFAKAERAAGCPLPSSGRAFLSVADAATRPVSPSPSASPRSGSACSRPAAPQPLSPGPGSRLRPSARSRRRARAPRWSTSSGASAATSSSTPPPGAVHARTGTRFARLLWPPASRA